MFDFIFIYLDNKGMLSGLCLGGGFFRGAGCGNIDHGKQSKDQRLDKAGEQVKVKRQNRGNTQGKNGYSGKNAKGLQKTEEPQSAADDPEKQRCLFPVLSAPENQAQGKDQQNDGYRDAAGGNQIQNNGGNLMMIVFGNGQIQNLN